LIKKEKNKQHKSNVTCKEKELHKNQETALEQHLGDNLKSEKAGRRHADCLNNHMRSSEDKYFYLKYSINRPKKKNC